MLSLVKGDIMIRNSALYQDFMCCHLLEVAACVVPGWEDIHGKKISSVSLGKSSRRRHQTATM